MVVERGTWIDHVDLVYFYLVKYNLRRCCCWLILGKYSANAATISHLRLGVRLRGVSTMSEAQVQLLLRGVSVVPCVLLHPAIGGGTPARITEVVHFAVVHFTDSVQY